MTFLKLNEFLASNTFYNSFIELIEEATKEELLNLAEDKDPSNYKISYIGFNKRSKRLKFEVGEYNAMIEIPEHKVISRLKGTPKEKIQLALSEDIKVWCSCNDFKFGGAKHNNSQIDSGIYKEQRPPDIQDPNRDHFLCKHLKQLLSQIDSIIEKSPE